MHLNGHQQANGMFDGPFAHLQQMHNEPHHFNQQQNQQHHVNHINNFNDDSNVHSMHDINSSQSNHSHLSLATTIDGRHSTDESTYDGIVSSENYSPELSAEQNPIYYNKNKLLFDLHVERQRRNHSN